MWVIDIRHWLDQTCTGPGIPQLRLVEKLGEIYPMQLQSRLASPVMSDQSAGEDQEEKLAGVRWRLSWYQKQNRSIGYAKSVGMRGSLRGGGG